MKRSGITQDVLAVTVGRSIRTVGRWVRGETSPDVAVIPLIEKAVGLHLGEHGPAGPGERAEDVINRVGHILGVATKSTSIAKRKEVFEAIGRIQQELHRIQMALVEDEAKNTTTERETSRS